MLCPILFILYYVDPQAMKPSEKEVIDRDVVFKNQEGCNWTLAEEELLLDAVEHHGFGSWCVFN